ncbi:MAG TPA: class I SAM-dependent methyltransferase [Bryobacteraceae bacterium]
MRPDDPFALTPAEYYDDRHTHGWMDSWPEDKRLRMIGLLRNAAGEGARRVLEYGCGVGVFANAVKAAMPQWEVHGCDISPVAISRARGRCPGVEFHLLTKSGPAPPLGSFDLIFTHHVLEHVDDVSKTVAHMTQVLKPGGKMLHVAPCSNPDSLEYRLSQLSIGLDSSGCLFCDDSSHARRLNSVELAAVGREHGLVPQEAFFANQFWGGIDYLTGQYHSILLGWLNPMRGVTPAARLKLLGVAAGLGGLCLLRQGPRHVLQSLRIPSGVRKKCLLAAAAPFAVVLYPVSAAVNKSIHRLREREWRRRKRLPNGSEMYLVFEKPSVFPLDCATEENRNLNPQPAGEVRT